MEFRQYQNLHDMLQSHSLIRFIKGANYFLLCYRFTVFFADTQRGIN